MECQDREGVMTMIDELPPVAPGHEKLRDEGIANMRRLRTVKFRITKNQAVELYRFLEETEHSNKHDVDSRVASCALREALQERFNLEGHIPF
jgi:hypothetical protein